MPPASGSTTSARSLTVLVAAAMILLWPVGLAALVAANRAWRAEGAGDTGIARHESEVARRRSRLGVTIGSIVLALQLATNAILVVLAVQYLPDLQARLADDAAVPVLRTAAPAEHDARPVDVQDLLTGDCFRAPATDQGWTRLYAVDVVPCDEEHDTVIITVHEHDEIEYPGSKAVADAAWDTCISAYWQYMGADAPTYPDLRTWPPSVQGWKQGNHASPCLLIASEPVRGSLRSHPDLVAMTPPDGETP